MPTAASADARAAIVYNPVRVPLERLKRAVEAQELRLGWRPSRWHETSSVDHGMQAATDALAHAPAVVLAAGGDGTVRAVGEALQGSGVPMALLPLGTGNLLARNLKLPLSDVDASVAAAFGGATRAIDVAIAKLEDEAGGHRRHAFLVMAGIGLDAVMAEQTNALAKRHLGWLAYVPPIARSITANRLLQLRYRIDGGPPRSDRAHTLIVGNCGTLTGSMLLLPAAAVDDGLLDVVIMRPKNRAGWAGIGTRLTMQQIAHSSGLGRRMLELAPEVPALAYAQGRQFDVRFEIPHDVQLDGDGFGKIVRARITVLPGALRVAVPG
jgi:diacylglycerol kinase (ATP)